MAWPQASPAQLPLTDLTWTRQKMPCRHNHRMLLVLITQCYEASLAHEHDTKPVKTKMDDLLEGSL